MQTSWTPADSGRLYNIGHWGEGYFSVNADGHVEVSPRRDSSRSIDLHELVGSLDEKGLSLPVLLRFPDILADRIDVLCEAFAVAIAQAEYRGGYTAVYPIKVNQQGSVVQEIVRHGGGRVGLEAGSKPELMAVLGLAPSGGVIVCNGYKDRAYIRLALIGRRLGHRVYIVVEKLSELDLVLEEADKLQAEPLLGLRVRLSSTSAGKWVDSGGQKSKFGLSASQIIEAVDHLRSAGRLETLRMLHYHLGSQVANVQDIQRAMREAGRYYRELHRLGAQIDCVDVGGGLAVDYEGTRSRSDCSMNYSMQEYAHNVVRTLQDVCLEAELPEPDIISESGRALTAHHAVLVTEVVDKEGVPDQPPEPPEEEDPTVLHNLWEVLQNPHERPPLECFHDAANALAESQAMYSHGALNIEQRARAEQIYYAVCRDLLTRLNGQVRAHREAHDELREKLADKYFCNLSIFQSLPDVWAIDQVFPILPLQRLDERPEHRVSLCDLTCDSDGRIQHYVDFEGLESTLPAHRLIPGQVYVLGIFLVGAYQEILGDMHNLFGDTDAVNVEFDADGAWRITSTEFGDRTDELLQYVHLEPERLLAAYNRKLEQAELEDAERQGFLVELEAGLRGYTYLAHSASSVRDGDRSSEAAE